MYDLNKKIQTTISRLDMGDKITDTRVYVDEDNFVIEFNTVDGRGVDTTMKVLCALEAKGIVFSDKLSVYRGTYFKLVFSRDQCSFGVHLIDVLLDQFTFKPIGLLYTDWCGLKESFLNMMNGVR